VPLVSVIIPAYNRATVLRRAIDSVLRQSFGDFEIIVVDDGSTDGTAAEAAQCTDPRLSALRHDTNRGAAAARNTGIRAAAGALIAFLDSDDEWLPQKLERQVAALQRAPANVLMSTTGYWMLRERSAEIRARTPKNVADWGAALRSGCVLSPGSTAMMRREAFAIHGLFDEQLRRLEDWDWLLRYVAKHDILVVPEPLARIHMAERMDPAAVLAAARLLRSKHDAAMRRLGFWPNAQFRAALLMEQGVTCYYAGQPLRALSFLAGSLALYPRKPPAFFAGAARRVVRMLRHGRSAPGTTAVEPFGSNERLGGSEPS
jgi:glycosyltransferase involved in cell wall biosynthesis